MKSIHICNEKYEKAITFSLAYQIFLLICASLMLDLGQCSQFMIVSMTAFWTSVIVLILRFRKHPSKTDILYIKWGFFPILITVPFIMGFIWHIRGV